MSSSPISISYNSNNPLHESLLTPTTRSGQTSNQTSRRNSKSIYHDPDISALSVRIDHLPDSATPLSGNEVSATSNDSDHLFFGNPNHLTEYEDLNAETSRAIDTLSIQNQRITFVAAVKKTVKAMMKILLPLTMLATASLCLFYKTEQYQFIDYQMAAAVGLSATIGACYYLGMELLAGHVMDHGEKWVNRLQVATICIFPKLFFALSQGELNVDSGTQIYESLWTALFAVAGATGMAEISRMVHKGWRDLSVVYMGKQFTHHPRSGEDASGTPYKLGELPTEYPLLKHAILTNVVFWGVAGTGLLITSTCIEERYVCQHVGISCIGIGVGNATGMTFSYFIDKAHHEGADGIRIKACRIANEVFATLSGAWPIPFDFSHDDLGMRFLATYLIGVSNTYAKSLIIRGHSAESESQDFARYEEPKTWRELFRNPKMLLEALWKFIHERPLLYFAGNFVVGSSAWFVYNASTESQLPISLAAASASVGLTASFISKIFIDRAFKVKKNQSKMLNTLKFLTSYNVTWIVLPFFVVTRDVEKIYSSVMSEDFQGNKITLLVVLDWVAYLSWGASIGLTAASRELSSAFIYVIADMTVSRLQLERQHNHAQQKNSTNLFALNDGGIHELLKFNIAKFEFAK